MGRKHRAARSATNDRLDEEELDIDSFSDFLRPSGLSIRDVSNDGNCFFRAVSDQLYGSEDYHMKLRERVCDYLDRHSQQYRSFIDEEQSYEEYVSDMRADGVWADNLELQAVSMAYNVNIRIHQSGKPSYDIRNHPAKNANAIHLSYHFGEHYASVRPLRTADLQVPAQHDPLPIPREPDAANPDNEQTRDPSARRPRHTRQDEDVEAVWKRAERGHCDVCALVERTRKAARNIRISESSVDTSDEKRDSAKKIEKDMKEARTALEDVGDHIKEGKAVHRIRTRKIAAMKWDSRYSSTTSNTSTADYSDDTASWSENEDDEVEYSRKVRLQTDMVFERLNDTENSVLSALEKVKSLVEDSSSDQTASKNARGSKKKEQEMKRKERKEKRRKEQERLARRGAVDDIRADHMGRLPELDIAI